MSVVTKSCQRFAQIAEGLYATSKAVTFSEHRPLERFAAGRQYRSVTIETATIGCDYSDVAELWLVEQTTDSCEVGSLVLG